MVMTFIRQSWGVKGSHEDNIEDVLNKADEEINTDIEEDQDKDSIIGIQAFHFELIIIEDIYY